MGRVTRLVDPGGVVVVGKGGARAEVDGEQTRTRAASASVAGRGRRKFCGRTYMSLSDK